MGADTGAGAGAGAGVRSGAGASADASACALKMPALLTKAPRRAASRRPAAFEAPSRDYLI